MFENFIESGLHVYGPWAVFFLLMLSGIGIPLGEDIITIPAGVLIAGGHLAFWPTLLAAYVGVVLADVLWFYLCSRYGTPLLHKRWFKRLIHPRRLLQAKHQFEQRGVWLVVMSRFIPSSRTSTITAAGMLHMPLWKFSMTTSGCVLISAPLQIGLGYIIGQGMGTEDSGSLVLRILGLIMVIVSATFVLSWWMQHRATSKQAPRARAKWLRRFRKPRNQTNGLTTGAVRPEETMIDAPSNEGEDAPARSVTSAPAEEITASSRS